MRKVVKGAVANEMYKGRLRERERRKRNIMADEG